jgi:hypothetical protein
MADNTIRYKIIVDQESGTATVRDFRGQIVATQIPLKQLRREFGNFAKEVNAQRFKQFNNSIKETRANMAANTRATGAATAATMELGRVISDAPYGIRGMANNVSQLASNVFFMTKQVDEATGKVIGFKGALRNIGRSLMGSMGVLVALQAIVAVIEGVANSSQKAANKVKSLTGEFDKLLNKINDLRFTMPDAISDILERMGITDESMVKFNESLNETLRILNSEFPEFSRAYKELSDTQKADPKVISNLISKYKELIGVRKSIALQEETLNELRGKSGKFAESNLKMAQDKYKALILQKIALEEIFKVEKKQEKKDKKTKLPEVEPVIEDRFFEPFFKTFQEKLRDLNIAKELGFISEKTYNEMKKSLEEKFASQNILDGVAPKLELGQGAKDAIDKYNKQFLATMKHKMNAEDWAGYADAFKQGLSLVSDFVDAQFDRDLAIEQNKTTAMNDELNKRLLNENLSKDERAKIQQEIWQNDDKLRKRQNEIKKKAFNANKAFQLSMAVADTASSALKAYGSQLVVGDPTSIVRAKIAAAVATATGLAQIATIAAQKFVPESAATPIRTASVGGGGGGVGDRSFNFNLVGANQQNQLVQAIQGQFDRPLKAYVVSKDITNQQQLDANTRATARFGG